VLLYACSCAPRLPILRSVPVHRCCHRCAGMLKHGVLEALQQQHSMCLSAEQQGMGLV
jgi:hypothetical protein